jgi:hypothetical protein
MNTRRLLVFSGMLVAVVAVAAISVIHVKAQPPVATEFRQLTADGFQASSSSAFILQGKPIGNNAIWQRTLGPALGSPFGMVPNLSTFSGGACSAEYSQDQIVTANKSTLLVQVWGYRCEPFNSPAGTHATNGIYSIQGGTGDFQGVAGGTGSIQIDARADGSTYLRISGSIRLPDSYRPF